MSGEPRCVCCKTEHVTRARYPLRIVDHRPVDSVHACRTCLPRLIVAANGGKPERAGVPEGRLFA